MAYCQSRYHRKLLPVTTVAIAKNKETPLTTANVAWGFNSTGSIKAP